MKYDVKKHDSHFYRYDVINHLINKFNYKSYLEIGTRDVSANFNKIDIGCKECIDPDPLSDSVTYKMTSDEAFNKIERKYDIIFIDGLHLHEQVDKDIVNSLDHLEEGGIVVLHDCNPLTEFMQREKYEYKSLFPSWNGTVWKSLVKLRCLRDNLNIRVIECDNGCGLIWKSKNRVELMRGSLRDKYLTYWYLNKYRKDVLNLISVEEFKNLNFDI
jgi:hypothetical protein